MIILASPIFDLPELPLRNPGWAVRVRAGGLKIACRQTYCMSSLLTNNNYTVYYPT